MGVDDELLEGADANMALAWRTLLSASPQPRAVEDDEALLLSSGIGLTLFNPAFVTGRPRDPTFLVRRVVDHYAGLGAPFVLYFRDEVAPGVAEACAVAGLVEHWQPALMVLQPIPAAVPDPPPDLQIVPLDWSRIDGYVGVLEGAFGVPAEAALVLARALLTSQGQAFLGLVGGEPVATAALFASHHIAGIYNVGTLPAWRSRGFGAAVTWAAVRAGARAGARGSALFASEQGEAVYRRMGYFTPSRYRQFEASPEPRRSDPRHA